MDKVIGIANLRSSIANVVKEVHENNAQYIVVKRSKARAVLISPEKLETLEVMADRELLEEIRRAKDDILSGRYKTYKEYFKRLLPEKPRRGKGQNIRIKS
jgi:prevent-host-death family protein